MHDVESKEINKRTLEQAFNAIFHGQESFADFCSVNINDEVETFTISGRRIFKTSEKLKKYLRFIDRVILRHLSKDQDVVHSFTKDKNTFTAVNAHVCNDFFFLSDIKSFFSHISTKDVFLILKRDTENFPISDIEQYIEMLSLMMTYEDQLPVGFSTSPQLSNSFLYDFDCAVKNYCSKKSLLYTRYADDLIVSSNSFEKLENLKAIIQELLKNHASEKLLLNDKKTHITHLGNRVKILGLMILPNRMVTVDAKYKNKLELLLHFYLTNVEKYKSYLEDEFNGSEKSAFGMLHYVQSIDPKYLEKLQRKYGIYAIRSLMEVKTNDHR